jgi:hypothetical protein
MPAAGCKPVTATRRDFGSLGAFDRFAARAVAVGRDNESNF